MCALLGVEDVTSTGCDFTWTNGRVFSKIDRVMVNEGWHNAGYLINARFPPPGARTDHSPAIASLFGEIRSFPKPFKFFNYWLTNAGFDRLLKENWRMPVRGSKQFVLMERGKAFKNSLKAFNFREYSNLTKRVKDLSKELEDLQLAADRDTTNEAIQVRIQEITPKVVHYSDSEKAFYAQKARLKHLLQSDRNSAFFHSLVKRNNTRNMITLLTREDGTVTKDQDEIIGSFIQFYKGMLGTESVVQELDRDIIKRGYCLNTEENDALTVPVTTEEIKNALFNINIDKSPGPDGYTSAFYRKNWEFIGEDLVNAVQEFFRSGQLLKSINSTAISLIPKTSINPKVSDYRPIACCNVVYKIITKILSKRMELLLPKILSPAQSAFTNGRSIMDNIYLAEEIMRGYTVKRGPPRCTVKIDLKKAYDTVNWGFLRNVLLGLNFHPIFVHWIMECVSSPSYTITINGSYHGYFRGKRGLRQGDPMSPSLFNLCMEYLSRLLSVRTTVAFNYHSKCERARITHLVFADDLMHFGRGDLASMQVLSRTMDEFSACSGLEVNQNKSNMFIAGTLRVSKEALLQIFGFPEGVLPIKYLGIPLASKRLAASDYDSLIDKLTAHVKKWPGKTLSFAGRLELIRSVLQGIQSYWLQAFPVPYTVIDRIIGIARSFLWGKKYAQVAWKDVCLPRGEGGLGLRDLRSWNVAIHAKILWNIHTKKDSLWIRWIHAKYLQNRSLWDWTAHVKNDSTLIKRLLSIRDQMLETHSRQEIIRMWEKWFASGGVHDAYDFFRPKGEKLAWARYVWKDVVPPKYSFITWLAVRGRLSTRDRLLYLDIDHSCPLCGLHEESAEHLFFRCTKTWAVWGKIMLWLGTERRSTTIKSVIKWARRQSRGSAIIQMAKRIALMATVFLMWKARNAVIFDGKAWDVTRVIFQIKEATYSLLYSRFPQEQVALHLPDR